MFSDLKLPLLLLHSLRSEWLWDSNWGCEAQEEGLSSGAHDFLKWCVLPSRTCTSAPTSTRFPERLRPSSTVCTLTLVGPSTCSIACSGAAEIEGNHWLAASTVRTKPAALAL